MRSRGKDFLYEALFPDGKRETLLSVPAYDFGWQSYYRLAEPLALPKGTKILCTAHFDNSASNPANPDPSATVRWGDQTREEMMIGYVDVVPDAKVSHASVPPTSAPSLVDEPPVMMHFGKSLDEPPAAKDSPSFVKPTSMTFLN